LLDLPVDKQASVDCSTVFSDILHRPFVCQHVDVVRLANTIPPSNMIERLSDLSCADFAGRWSRTPFVLEQPARAWPASKTWTLDYFLKTFPFIQFRAETVDWSFQTYYEYLTQNRDESPLYLFDKKFAEKMNLKVGQTSGAAYWKPDCFGPDLFEVLREDRPAHRWLIIGPERSGSTFHKDPNGTSKTR
jgi:hypothetical protein